MHLSQGEVGLGCRAAQCGVGMGLRSACYTLQSLQGRSRSGLGTMAGDHVRGPVPPHGGEGSQGMELGDGCGWG